MSNIFLNIILFIYNQIAFHNLGISIIIISALSRIVLYPFIKQQLTYGKKMNELQPHLKKLKEKHKDNKQAFAQAQMQLLSEHGINPAAGCLPTIVQIVVLFGLLGALNKILTMDLDTNFLIWNLAKPDAYKINGVPFMVPGVLVLIASITQYFQTKMMMPTPPKIYKEDKKKEKEEKTDFMEEFSQAQSSMVWMFPVMFLFLGTFWPSGLALYWSTSSIIAIIQQKQIIK